MTSGRKFRAASRRRAKTRRVAGFTLIEVLAVVLVTALLLGATINFYINLTRQATHASENVREVRRATALLDRIAVDLEHTMLVKKPAEQDALTSPWLFLAQSRFSSTGAQPGSDQIKFIRRDLPRASDGAASDLLMVAYTLERSEEGHAFVLRRWSTPELPESLEHDFPRSDAPGTLVVADDLSHFSLRFLDEGGQWHDRWDSTQVADSADLPLAVEIEVALAPPPSADPDAEEVQPMAYTRLVELPLRPLDLEAMLKPKEDKTQQVAANQAGAASNGGTATQGCTLGEAIDLSKIPVGGIPGLSESDLATLAAAVRNSPAAALAPYAAALAGSGIVKEGCL
jgi:type II secretion system protein J